MHHLVVTTSDRLPLAVEERSTRAMVRAISRCLGSDLLLFSLVDEHVHVAVWADAPRSQILARSLVRALSAVMGRPLPPVHVSAIDGRRHLDTLVTYFLRQSVKHGLRGHPAAWRGSCLGELVGVRSTRGFDASRLREALPRLTDASVLRRVELDRASTRACDDELVFDAGPRRVVDAAAASLAVMPDERSADAVMARRAAIELLAGVGYRSEVLARAAGVTRRAVRRLQSVPAPPEITALVRRRLTFETTVASAPAVRLTERERGALRQSPFQ